MTRIVGVLPKPLRWALAALIALGLALAIAIGWMAVKAHRLRRAGRRLAADLGLLEMTLVPAVPAKVGPASVTAAHRAWDALAAGGDFYDAFELGDERMGLVMGDVEGHGRPALPLTASVRYTLRAFLEAGLGPRDALRVASGALGHTLGDRLVTAVVAVYDSAQGTLTYACAGHPAPLIIGAPFESPAACSSPPIGAGLVTGRRQVTTPLRPGTAAVFYTDGAIDPRLDRSGTALSRAAGLGGPDIGAEELLGRLLQKNELPDDTSACVIRPLPGAAHGTGEHVEEVELDALGLARSGKRFLSACGVAPADIERALDSARQIADKSGAVAVTVRRHGGGIDVTAAAPAAPSLPVAKTVAAAA